MKPLLSICIPTYNRLHHLRRLMPMLRRECAGRDDVRVFVSDNASTDGSWAYLEEQAATFPHLALHRQPENLGAAGNIRWLAANAPEAAYTWVFGDDDVLEAGAIEAVATLLRTHRPGWLFLPHAFTDDADRVVHQSPCPPEVTVLPGPRALFERFHHWLTFISATIVAHDALAAVGRQRPIDNAYEPFLMFFEAAAGRPCVVADRRWVRGGSDISWRDRHPYIVTVNLVGLHADGLWRAFSDADFAACLDRMYEGDWALPFWAQVPPGHLEAAIARYPGSQALKRAAARVLPAPPATLEGAREALRALDAETAERQLGTLLAERPEREAAGWLVLAKYLRRDAYGALDALLAYTGALQPDPLFGEAAAAPGPDMHRYVAAAAMAEAQQGHLALAEALLRRVLTMRPTMAEALNDLGVIRHLQGDAVEAVHYLARALAANPYYADARANMAEVRAAGGPAPEPRPVASSAGAHLPLSFCIITGGKRPEMLQRVIRSIQAQHMPEFEILVAGRDRPRDGVRYLPAEAAADGGYLGAMRNFCARAARYETLVILDDDILLTPDWYAQLRAHAGTFDILTSSVRMPDGGRYWDHCTFGGPRGHMMLDELELDDHLYTTGGGGWLIRRELARQAGWNEDLAFYQGEDVEFSGRCRALGATIRHCAAAVVYHAAPIYTQVGRMVLARKENRTHAWVRELDGLTSQALVERVTALNQAGELAEMADCLRYGQRMFPGDRQLRWLWESFECALGGHLPGTVWSPDGDARYASLLSLYAEAAADGPACAIVMVLGEHLAQTQRCLEALIAHTPAVPFEVVLIDNGTRDGTAEFLGCLDGDLTVVTLDAPASIAEARNAGAARARSPWLVFLDPEALPADGWLEGLLAETDGRPEVAVVGARLRSAATGRVLHAGVDVVDGEISVIGRGLAADDPAVAGSGDRTMVAGACMLVRRDIFERLGGFAAGDALEDLDFCLRARRLGLGVRYAARADLWMDEALEPGSAAAPVPEPPVVLEAPRVPRAPAKVLYHGPVYDASGYADEVRHMVLGLEDRGWPVALRAVGRHSHAFRSTLEADQRERLDALLTTDAVPEDFISLIHFPATVFQRLPQAGYRIGRTMFETDGLPPEWVAKCNMLDELWVPTDFNVETFRRAGVTTPLVTIPGGVDAERYRPGLAPLPIPGARGKVFLSVFEWTYRKGWDVLLEAWARAFGPSDDVTLVLRTYMIEQPEAASEIDTWVTTFLSRGLGLSRSQVARIVLMSEQVAEADMPRLYAAADAYVAPSRGEGWGRPQMEAMACGLPVIATRWSGTTAFMTDENSLPLDITGLETIDARAEREIYHGQQWAAPSVAHLVDLMRRVVAEPEAMTDIGRRARRDVVERWSWEHATALAAARLEAISAELAARPALLPPLAPEAPGLRWEGAELSVHSFAVVNREFVRRLAASGRLEISAVTKEAAEFKPDAALLGVERCINRPLTRPTAVTVRHQWPPDFTPPSEGAWVMVQPWEFGGLPDEWVLGMKDGVDEMWVYTTWLRDCYLRSGLPADRVHVVPLGVDTARFRPDGPRYPLKTRKRFKFLFLGGTIPRKGIDALLEAYVSSFSADDDVCLVIKGIGAETFYSNSSPLNDVIRQLVANEGTDSRLPAVEFLDAALTDDEVASIYRACDALVHPYRGEGFGLPMAEAMASGLPVVVTGAGAAMDFCDETNAYLIPAVDVPIQAHELGVSSTGYWWAEPDREALGRLMREVVANPEAARDKGRRGRECIERDFTWDRAAAVALERIEALARRVPVRFRAPEPFRSGLAPWPLDAHRRVVFFHQPDWASGAWREVVTSYARSLGPDADATLALWLDPASGMSAERAAEALLGALAAVGLDPEAMPDVLLVTEALDDAELARLYTAADWVVPAGDARQAERAALVGRPVLTDLSAAGWHQAIAAPAART